ncbi:uncharacterized protein LOC142235342 [Haematobia irritans]|uniref:uncharacterized protein LOC142235342 n=1 Tax=Haematobia irritans TaxID=7368 RepID=UPI003F504448
MLLVRKVLIADALSRIFNKMIEDSIYPTVMKIHKIVPVPKHNASTKIIDYRPVSILPIFDKIFETIIFDQLTSHVNENDILYNRQYGFLKGSGTRDALVNALDCKG